MGFFTRKKKQKQLAPEKRLQENLGRQSRQTEGIADEDYKDKKKVQHHIIRCFEQMIEANKEIKEQRDEYRMVTDYLSDIQVLEELPDEDWEEIRNVADNVQNLNRKRDEYQNAEKRISDTQFVQMQQEEERMPGAILRLQSNEAYQNVVKKDMNYLEGEKTEWHYNKLELMHQQKILRNLSMILLGVFIMSMAVLLVLQIGFQEDTTYAWMSIFFIAAVGGFAIYLKMSWNQTEIQRSEVNLNHAIVLLNKVKFKYVNVTNAVDYVTEKYHVKNSYELNYLWEQYLNEVKEREKFKQANEDLEYYNGKLVQLLRRYRLYDARVWTNQSSALMDKKEMVEVKHHLIVRRQKLRSQMEYNSQIIRERRTEIDQILKKQNLNSPEIREIINSIDQLDMA